MSTISRLSAVLFILTLVACEGSPPTESSPTPEAPPTASPEATLTPAPSPTAGPTQAPTASPEPSPVGPTPTPAARPTPSFSPTPEPAAWTGPTQVSERLYQDPSLVVDASGVPHVAATLDGGIFYLTNGSGSWTRKRVSRPPRRNSDSQPSIAIDGDGSLWIAFTRRFDIELGSFPEAIYAATNRSGSWSSPRQLVGDAANSPSLKVRDGGVYLAYILGAPSDVIDDEPSFPLMFGTDRSGSFRSQQLADNGADPRLELDADGRPHILFGSPFWAPSSVGYAAGARPSGTFSVETLPGTNGDERNVSFALDSSGTAHAIWSSWPEEAARPTVHYARRSGGSWSRPSVALHNAWGAAISAGPGGAVHAVAMGPDGGVWHISDPGGSLVTEQLSRDLGQSPQIAVDASGRPQLIFLGGESGDLPRGFWYALGPAN